MVGKIVFDHMLKRKEVKIMIAFLCYLITALVYTAVLLWGIFGDHSNDALGYGYGLFSFFIIIPVISFLGALRIGISKKR